MKKVLIIVALISVNQAFANTPAKSTDPKTTKTVAVSVKKTTTKKATASKVDWYMGTAAVTATTDNTGCGGNGGGGWAGFGTGSNVKILESVRCLISDALFFQPFVP